MINYTSYQSLVTQSIRYFSFQSLVRQSIKYSRVPVSDTTSVFLVLFDCTVVYDVGGTRAVSTSARPPTRSAAAAARSDNSTFNVSIVEHTGCLGKIVFFHNSLQPLPRLHCCKRPSKISTQCECTECTATPIGW